MKPVGLESATFQVLRRTNVSLSRRAMIDDKVAADQRGHGLGVSLEVCSITGVQQKIDAAKRLESKGFNKDTRDSGGQPRNRPFSRFQKENGVTIDSRSVSSYL